MLGEGARTAAGCGALSRRLCVARSTPSGRSAGDAALPARPGISVKLSALHPRFEPVSRARVLAELVPDVIALARQARRHDLNFTVDAEEADRLELSLEVFAAVLADPLAARLGGLRPGGAGLSEARRRGDRLAGRDRAGAPPPPDGAAGQGRLLGQRDQARAGARARRLSGLHPQADDRSLLPRLRRQAAGGAAAAVTRNSPPTMRSRSRA